MLSLKLVLLGESAVGKSALAIRFCRGDFFEGTEATIGAAFMTKNILVQNIKMKLEIWDTAGQERYRSLAPMYYRAAAGAIIVYDITLPDSFEKAKFWVKELQRSAPEAAIALVGNKNDLELQRRVSQKKVDAFAQEHGCFQLTVSAKTNFNVERLFNEFSVEMAKTCQIKEKIDTLLLDAKFNQDKGTNPKKRCCF